MAVQTVYLIISGDALALTAGATFLFLQLKQPGHEAGVKVLPTILMQLKTYLITRYLIKLTKNGSNNTNKGYKRLRT